MTRIRCQWFVVLALLSLSAGVVFGANQHSPIDIAQGDLMLQNPLPGLGFAYAAGGVTVRNPGHNHAALQVEGFPATHTLTVGDGPGATTWELAQIHFHARAEHKLLGQAFDMEMHMVHKKVGDPSKILVVGRWVDRSNNYVNNIPRHLELDKIFNAGVINQLLPTSPPHPVVPIPTVNLGPDGMPANGVEWNKIPATPEPSAAVPPASVPVGGFNPSLLVPLLLPDQKSYRYPGTLTAFGDQGTDVDWIVLHERMPMDPMQYDRYKALLTDLGLGPNGNGMPVQNIANPGVFKVMTDVPEPSGTLLLLSFAGVAALRRRRITPPRQPA